MNNNYVRHDETLMPMQMGSPVRTPDYARSAWGLPSSIDEETVVELYSAEWQGGNEGQLALVSEAAQRAGFGDYPQLLRQKVAEEVKEAIKEWAYDTVLFRAVVQLLSSNDKKAQKKVDRITREVGLSSEFQILDIGAGPGLSALAVWQELPIDIRPKTRFVLLDPSRGSLESAQKVMQKHGISHEIICDVDLNIGKYIAEGTVDVLIGVASIHHHSAIPFDLYYRVLKPRGIAVFADWHNSIWEHPARVYQFLQAFEWPEKEAGLRNWLESYPEAGQSIPEPTNPADRQANQDITRFWQGYLEIIRGRDVGPNAIWPLEGHRPVERYVKQMREAGFNVPTNPDQVLPGSRLLMITIGEKTGKKEV